MIVLRLHDFKIICITVLVFFTVSTVIIMLYTNCISNTTKCLSIKTSILQTLRKDHKHAEIQFTLSKLENLRRLNFRSWKQVVVHSNPTNWPGEMGKAVSISPAEKELQEEKFKLNQFNLLASDKIALNRTLSDVRHKRCKNRTYTKKLPTTSIVIVFYNEAWSTLLRTVHSVIRMSPKELVEEIILVDDASERIYLKQQLDDYVSKLDVPVKVLRMSRRSGLIRARISGAAAVKGQVITFLDAHCECTIGWLEPLLDRIGEDRKRVVCPIIDVISRDSFQHFTTSDINSGGFIWQMLFRWDEVPKREIDRRKGDRTLPFRTPTMAGGLFSIDKGYFKEIGTYDEGMNIWGGENLELSFRVWMCGGMLEIVPCSHVGHIFRYPTPYSFPGGRNEVLNHNNARLVEVWLDEWKEFFYAMNPAARKFKTSNVTERKNLRKRLKCKSFRWYLENIYPETQLSQDYYYFGEIRNEITNMCLDTYHRKKGENVAVQNCHGKGGNQIFLFTKRKQISSNDICLEASLPQESVKLVSCHSENNTQLWKYDELKKVIIHILTGKCLDKPDKKNPISPLLKECDGRTSQKWIMNGKLKRQIT